MILCIKPKRAVGSLIIIPIKVRYRYANIGDSIISVRRIECGKHVRYGFSKNAYSCCTVNFVIHRTGRIQHQYDVHALFHGYAGGGKLYLRHAGVLEVHAGSALFHANGTRVGILGVVAQLRFVVYGYNVGYMAYLDRGYARLDTSETYIG